MQIGIRYRLLIPLGLLLVGVVGASLWSAHVAARRAENRVARQVDNISQTLSKGSFPLKQGVLEQMKSLSGAEFLFVPVTKEGLTTFTSGSANVPSESAFAASSDSSIGPLVLVHGEEFRCRRLMLRQPHPDAGGTVYIYYPEELLEEAISDAERPSLLGLFFGFVAVGLTFAIGQRLVSRIRELEKRTRLIAAGDFSPMPLPRAKDELRDLTASVNDMAERLAKLHQAVETHGTAATHFAACQRAGAPVAQWRHGREIGSSSLSLRASRSGHRGPRRDFASTEPDGIEPAPFH